MQQQHDAEFQNLSNCILSPEFDWHYLSGILSHDNPAGSYQFIHLFYDPDTGSQSPYLPEGDPLDSDETPKRGVVDS